MERWNAIAALQNSIFLGIHKKKFSGLNVEVESNNTKGVERRSYETGDQKGGKNGNSGIGGIHGANLFL